MSPVLTWLTFLTLGAASIIGEPQKMPKAFIERYQLPLSLSVPLYTYMSDYYLPLLFPDSINFKILSLLVSCTVGHLLHNMVNRVQTRQRRGLELMLLSSKFVFRTRFDVVVNLSSKVLISLFSYLIRN